MPVVLVATLALFAINSSALQPVVIPAYSQVPHATHYASADEYQAAAGDKRYAMQRLAYSSDGLTEYAYVYGPRATGAKKLPVVVFSRGSWTWPNGFAGELVSMAHRLALRGYLVVAPMYRGSGGGAGRDEMGGADLDDLMSLKPALARIHGADTNRVYLYGESRGGMMVYEALRDGFPAKAAAVVGAFTDLAAMFDNPKWAAAGAQIWPNLATHRKDIIERRSAVHWPDKIGAPILIIHGARDQEVPPEQSLLMTAKLLQFGKAVQFILVDGADHTISARSADRDEWVADWFDRHR